MERVSGIDLLLGVLFIALVANAARRGLLREGSLLAALGVGLWSAGWLFPAVQMLLSPGGQRGPWSVLTYLALVLSLLILAAALSALVAPWARRGPLRLLDRVGGAGLGVLEATFIIGLLALLGERLGLLQPAAGGAVGRAAEVVRLGLGWLTLAIPREVLALAQLGG